MKSLPPCRELTRYNITCWKPGMVAVYWIATGADERVCCAQHVARALRELREATNNGTETFFKVRFLSR